MDASQFSSRKIAIFASFTLLLMAAPRQAGAQTQFVVNNASGTSFSFTVPGTGQSLSLAISAADSSTPTFTATVSYPNGGTNWVSLNGFCAASGASASGTAGSTSLTVAQGCSLNPNLQLGNQNAQITLTASGVTTATITLAPGSAQGTITASGSPGGSGVLNLQTVPGSSTTGTITLSTSNTSPIGFTISLLNQTYNGYTWLSVAQTGGATGQVSASQPASLTVTGNAAGLTSTPTQGTVQINYNGQTLPVLVNFTVGSGSGNLSVSQNPINWTFNTGGNAISTPIGVNSPAATYTATITSINPTGNYWLQLMNNVGTTGTQVTGSTNTALTLQSTSNILSLATGTYQATILITDSSGNSTTVNVFLTVNGGSSVITASPNPIYVNAPFGSNTLVPASVTVTSSVGGSLTANISSGTGLSVTPNNAAINAGGSVQLTVYGNPTGLAQNTYSGTLTVTVGGNTANFPISFIIGNGSGSTVGSSIGPSNFQFNYQTDGTQSAPQQQGLMIGGSSTYSITTSVNDTTGPTNWLTVTPTSGTAPAQVFVAANPSGMSAGQHTGTIRVAFGDGSSQTANVNFNIVTGSPLVYAQPGDIIINQQTGQITNYVYLYSTNGVSTPLSVSTSTSWLTFVSSLPTSSQSSFAVTANTSNLPSGMNQGNIVVNYGLSSLNIPVIAYVTNGTGTNPGGGALTFSPSSITLNGTLGSGTPATQNLGVTTTSQTPTYFSATTSETNCTQTNWLNITNSAGYVYSGFTQQVSVSANPSGLPAGTCTGSIVLSSGGLNQTVPVTFNVGGGISVSASSLTFTYTSGGTTPAAQTINVSNSAGVAVTYSVASSTSSGGNWLSASATSGTTPGSFTVSANPAGLAAGTYTGTVAVTPTGGTATNISVSFTITTPTISVSPTSLSFSYQAGGATPAAQSVTVSGGSFTATATSTSNWLSVTPTSSATATNISVSVSPTGLSAGTYNGTIAIAGSNGATGSATVNVTLTVTAPLPTVTAVVNAASFLSGPIAPGEVISIGGSGLGPASPAFLTLDPSGNVATTIGGVTVTIGGFAAPLVYASNTQINAIVPYEIAGQIAPSLVVKFLGQTSNGYTLQAGVTSPAIFTQSAQGSGPGAILNQDYTVNGPSRPAAKGSIVQVFMTGEGKTTPTAVTGKVNNVTDASQLPVPLIQPVSATVGGQPAQVVFAAEAPGQVSGVMQVNLVIPNTVGSGPQAIFISVGTAASQSGVTVSVQ